jgi:hypothetical protein
METMLCSVDLELEKYSRMIVIENVFDCDLTHEYHALTPQFVFPYYVYDLPVAECVSLNQPVPNLVLANE